MAFRRFPDLRRLQHRIFPARTRTGTPEHRGKLLRWPAELTERPIFSAYAKQTGFLRRVLPGIVTGAADIDPSLVITATVAGVFFGYQLLWVVVLCVPFLLTVFSVSGRIGHETRRGLVDLLRRHYGPTTARTCAVLLVIINMAMIVADLMAVTDALSIIMDQRRIFFIAFVAFAVWYILVFSNYQKITHALAFLSLPLFTYVVVALFTHPPIVPVLKGALLPRIYADRSYAMAVLGIFGSLLTPFLLVWQTSSRSESSIAGEELHESAHLMGTAVTTIVCFSVIVVAGTVLRPGMAHGDLTTRQAAMAFGPVLGDLGPIFFALGLVGAGMVALPVLLASLCYAVSESMDWQSGLSANPWEAKGFYVLISAGMVVAATLNFFPLDPVKTLYYSQILAGALTVPILVFILLLSNDRRVMRTVNSRAQNFWIGAAAGALTATGLLLAWSSFRS